HLGLAFRRATEVDHLEARASVGADAQHRDVIVGALAAAVERDRARAALSFVHHVLHGLELAVRPNRPEIGIDHVIDQRRETCQALLARPAICRGSRQTCWARCRTLTDAIALATVRGPLCRLTPRRPIRLFFHMRMPGLQVRSTALIMSFVMLSAAYRSGLRSLPPFRFQGLPLDGD